MKKIKIIKSRSLKEEEEVIDQQPQDTSPEQTELTYESNPLEFILMKYPSLQKTLVGLLTDDFRDYVVGVYIMAPKPTIFKIVLHNNRSFYLIYMGDDNYEAKVSGKKYWLPSIGDFERATMAIADLLMMGTPPTTQGPETETTAAPDIEPETPKETPSETPAEEEAPEELAEGILGIKLVKELAKKSYDILTPEAKKVAQELIKMLGVSQSQIQPDTKNHVVIYDDNRKDLVDKTTKSKKYGKPTDPNAGDFKVGSVTVSFKPFKTSGEFYELKPQALGVTTDKFISINQLKKELTTGIQNHKSLSDVQKKFILSLVNEKNTLTPDEKKEALDDKYFIKEVLKNLGEILGAIVYSKKYDGKTVFFPSAGNYPLVDYFIKKSDGSVVDISAKSSKGKGNIIKIPDINKKVKDAGGKLEPEIQKIFDIVSNNNAREGSLKLIPAFGSKKLKQEYKDFLQKNPNFPKSYDASERIRLEKEIIKILNKYIFVFSDIFKTYVDTQYVKYGFDENTLKPNIQVIKGEDFFVYLSTKNSPNHDGERIGFQLKAAPDER